MRLGVLDNGCDTGYLLVGAERLDQIGVRG